MVAVAGILKIRKVLYFFYDNLGRGGILDFNDLKSEIVYSLESLDPDRIILFGSYAIGKEKPDSDIDLLIVNNRLNNNNVKNYRIEAKLKLLNFIRKHKIGVDLLACSDEFLNSRDDYFYKNDILKDGRVLYERNRS